ncbi:hypothetical protein B5F40_15240 [Gordonibacter sp. An230]|uniref:DEAD/DEAH box helicase n=1 Tax=Gordonibacter sp. An230 TaxID=1965592 RepID=UPI000B3AE695|nr:AAA domain-containing protein [Gordonibacter sp. An230]OUO86305.1 hypothetical protein B5F40_15240 [Gordonibacter sp. An230]
MGEFGQCANVVDYWHLLEFLDQGAFMGQSPEERASLRAASKVKSAKKAYSISICHKGTVDAFDYLKRVELDARMYPYHKFVSTDACMCAYSFVRGDAFDALKKRLDDRRDARPEKPRRESVACFGLRVDSEGWYLRDSLRISPILWALDCSCDARSELIHHISVEAYQSFTKRFESELLHGRERVRVDKDFFDALYSLLHAKIRGAKELIFGQEVCYKYARTGQEDDELRVDGNELSKSYILHDLALVKSTLLAQMPMPSYVRPYILAPKLLSDEFDAPEARPSRWAFSRCSTAEDVIAFMSRAIRVEDLPLGKWPSRFRPSFMQQAAITLALESRAKSDAFSINGPPGTGKTTLLKEIVAENIVRRAKLLSKYATPDDAFAKQSFKDGESKKGGYSFYYPQYAVFKDPEIAQYGMLVASANNKAVENITKELPGLDRMLDGVSDAEDMSEVRDLFCPPEDVVDLSDSDVGYFTELADLLLDEQKGADDDVADRVSWGLVSAPLGKQKNVGRFSRCVLKNLLKRCTNENMEQRAKEGSWSDAVTRFENQMAAVLAAREELREQSDQIVRYTDLVRALVEARAKLEAAKAHAEGREGELSKRQSTCEAALSLSNASLGRAYTRVLESEEQVAKGCEAYERAEREYERELKNLELSINARSWLQKLLRIETDDMRRARERSNGSLERFDKHRLQVLSLKQKLEARVAEHAEAKRSNDCRKEELASILHERERLKECVDSAFAEYSRLQCEAEHARKRLKLTVCFPNGSIEQVDAWEFANDLISDDPASRAWAHASSLWADAEFDRAREKLLFCALRLQKEFVLGSKCFRSNMKNLLMMWGQESTQIEYGGEWQRANFSVRDREASYLHLFNSLFLLVPVLSTTFASVERLLGDVREPGALGMLIVDEAGQSSPQIALGALLRSSSAVVLGDPLQVQPVVNDEVDVIRRGIRDENLVPYRAKCLSVQHCADHLNVWGTYLNGEWLGFPLTVHRRCVSPMYDISNELSYGGTMNQQTRPPSQEKMEGFVFDRSFWLNVAGKERGNGDRYVEAQGTKALEFVKKAFACGALEGEPRLFVIAPFKSVVAGFKAFLQKSEWYGSLGDEGQAMLKAWMRDGIGTVHTFQGKEADEVIFLLGCDSTTLRSAQWVDSHIVNVAVTRAKYRLCVIGDYRVWRNNELFKTVKKHLDTYAIRQLSCLDRESEGFAKEADGLLGALPPAESFVVQEAESQEYEFVDDAFCANLESVQLPPLTQENLEFFNLSKSVLDGLEKAVANNIECGIRLYYFFRGMRERDVREIDASCCSILFCKAMEGHLKSSLKEKLAGLYAPSALDKEEKRITIGTFASVLKKDGNAAKLAGHVDGCNEAWCKEYSAELNRFKEKRNNCCHHGKFEWSDMSAMLNILFRHGLLINTTYVADHFREA